MAAAEEQDFLSAKPLVVDNGTGMSKNGFAGEDQPRSVFPTLVGYPKYVSIMSDVEHYSREYYIGEEALSMKGVLKLNYPVEHGIIEDWIAMEKIWHYTFFTDLRVDPSEHPILLTEAPLNPRKKPREDGTNNVRNLQCSGNVCIHASSSFPLWFRTNDRLCY